MSIAKRDKGKVDQAPPNEDEGTEPNPNDENRFYRTNQAIKWAKGGLADAKLFIYAKTGQIEESPDGADVTEALQKLNTYKEQLNTLLTHAENWTVSMLETWNHQKSLIDALNEANSVIHTFGDNNNNNETETENSLENTDNVVFVDIVQGISKELHLDQQESEKRYGQASSLLVVPLRNILNHEIQHAVDMKRRYTMYKRQFDNCCTNITHLKNKIEELEHPDDVEDTDNDAQSTFGKLKMGFGKLIQSNPTKEDLENKLKDARLELPQYVKGFDCTKQQLLEAIGIVEEKLNIEVVYYVQQFYSFVLKWKSGNNASDGYCADEEVVLQEEKKEDVDKDEDKDEIEEVDDDAEVQVQVQEIEIKGDDNVKGNDNEKTFVKDLQIDAMINSGADLELDEVSLGDDNEEMVKEENVDNGNDNVDNNNVDNNADGNDIVLGDIEISETHDVET